MSAYLDIAIIDILPVHRTWPGSYFHHDCVPKLKGFYFCTLMLFLEQHGDNAAKVSGLAQEYK